MLRAIRTRSGITVFLVSLLLLGILLRTTGNLGPIEDLAYPIFSPVETALVGLGDGIGNLFGGFQQVNALRAQVQNLEGQLNRLTVDEVRVRELEIENSQLRAQLHYKEANPDYLLLGGTILQSNNPDLARVTGQDPLNLLSYIIVDQGREEGVAIGMPAVTPRGLVGRVTEVGAHWSRVLLIVDPSSSVNAVIQSSRATGVIQGQIGGMLILKYVPQGEGIEVNDLVLTSGIGGTFPKRLVIGQVVAVQKRDTDLFQEATVKPSVDSNQLEFVLIIKKFTPTDITTEPTPTPTPSPTRTPAPTPGS
jgi:rod shape-determining protein MreC